MELSRRGLRIEEKNSKNVDFSLWGNRATTQTHIFDIFISAKTHFLLFQKWQKKNFCTWKILKLPKMHFFCLKNQDFLTEITIFFHLFQTSNKAKKCSCRFDFTSQRICYYLLCHGIFLDFWIYYLCQKSWEWYSGNVLYFHYHFGIFWSCDICHLWFDVQEIPKWT